MLCRRMCDDDRFLPGTCGSPSPRTLRRFWAEFTLPNQLIKEEHPLPRIPVPQSLNHLRGEKNGAGAAPATGSKIPLAQATCCAELQPVSPPPADLKHHRPSLSSSPRGAQSLHLIRSHDMKPVGISGGTPPQSLRQARSPDPKLSLIHI